MNQPTDKGKNYIYFYNYLEDEIHRINEKIILRLRKEYGFTKCLQIYSEKSRRRKAPNLLIDVPKIYLANINIYNFEKLFLKYPPSILLIDRQRIPEMLMFSIFKKNHIQTVLIQHGLLVEFLPRVSIIFLFLSNSQRYFNYIKYSIKIAQYNKLSKYRVLKEMFNIFIKGNESNANAREINKAPIRAQYALIFDKSWDEFFINNYGYKKKQISYIGSFDSVMIKNIVRKHKESASCYICQTLVEDGRYSRKKFLNFLALLKESIPNNKTLYIKLHPRSDISLYEPLKENSNIKITKELPNCTKYLGHYSSLLEIVYYCSPFIFLWEFPGHKIQNYFRKYGYFISNNSNELKKFLEIDPEEMPSPDNYYIKLNDEIYNNDPIKNVCDFILNIQ